MRVAYTCPGATSTAHTPVPVYDGRGFGPWAGKDNVIGQPGTQAVPAGLPDFGSAGLTVNGQPVRGAGAGYNQGSGTMPNVWYPQLYYLRQLDGSTLVSTGQGPSVYSDNQMPVPARDPLGRAALLGVPPSFLGQANVQGGPPLASKGPAWPDWSKIARVTGYVGPGGYGV
jgi:hypothetical protein